MLIYNLFSTSLLHTIQLVKSHQNKILQSFNTFIVYKVDNIYSLTHLNIESLSV
jgi:hypothetical protein